VKFVIGTGYTSASTIGRKPATLAEMRRASASSAVCSPATRGFRGHVGRLGYAANGASDRDGGFGTGSDRAGGRDRGRRAAAGGFNRASSRGARALERGAKRSGRRLEDLEIVWAVRVGTARTQAEARRLARPTAVHWGVLRWAATGSSPPGCGCRGFEIPEAVSKIYPDLSLRTTGRPPSAATSFVPDDVVARSATRSARGHAGRCAARIVEMTKLGVRNLLPHATAHLRAPGARDRGVPRRRIPAAARGGAAQARVEVIVTKEESCEPCSNDGRGGARSGIRRRRTRWRSATRAPDFTLNGPDGKPVKLTDLTAKGPVVLYTSSPRSPAPERKEVAGFDAGCAVRSRRRPGRGREWRCLAGPRSVEERKLHQALQALGLPPSDCCRPTARLVTDQDEARLYRYPSARTSSSNKNGA